MSGVGEQPGGGVPSDDVAAAEAEVAATAEEQARAVGAAGERARVDAQRVELHIPEGHRRGETMSRGQRAFYRFVWYVVQLVGRSSFRLKVVGAENVPADGAFIVSPNHRSNLDTPVVAAITKRRLRYMGKESLWKSDAGGWFLTTLGGFPVQRGAADREALRACIEVIERGEPLVMFPEGTRQFGPEVQPLFDGPAYVAARTQVPILPIGLGGSERAMPKGVKLPRPAKMVLVVGQPIAPPPPGENGRVPRRAVKELSGRLKAELQVLFDEAQALAGHPNRR